MVYSIADEILINSIVIKPKPDESIESFFNDLIKKHKIVIFSKTTCPFCAKVKDLFNSLNESYASLDLDEIGNNNLLHI
jgi:protein-disulfide isomerase